MKIGNHSPKQQPGLGHRPHEGHHGKGKPDCKPPNEGGSAPDFPEKYKSPFSAGAPGGQGKPPMKPEGDTPT